jgi:hypothetical protein
MANPQQGTIDSVSKIYQVVEKTQYAVPVLYCFFGTAKYLGLDQKSTEDIQRRVDEFLKTEGSASYRRDAFKQLIKTAPAEFRSRVVDLVGTKFLSEEIPSKNHPPILKAPFNYYMIVAACTKRYSQVIFGNNASVLEKLDILRSDLYARSSLRSRAEHEEALSQGRAVDTQRVLRENDEMAETEIRRILNHEQLVEFSQFGMSGTISSSIRSFFANNEVQKYLNDPQMVSSLLEAADRIDKEADDLVGTFIAKSLRDYVVSERLKGASARRFKRGQFDRKGMVHSDSGFLCKPSTGVGTWYVVWIWIKRRELSSYSLQG